MAVRAARVADGRQTRSYLAQWLGASTLALPVVVLAVIAAVALAVRTLAPRGGPQQLITIGASAPAASLAFAATYPIRDALFGAGDSAALPAPVRVARDTLVALAIALPLAALGVSLFLSGRTRVTRTRAVVLAGGAAVLAAASLGGSVRAADPDPGQPCPATAPVKTFDVQAIDVNIPLNRFGDHDPHGQDVRPHDRGRRRPRRGERRRRSPSACATTPIQPLVIRANEGDCVEITLHQQRDAAATYGMHIDGLVLRPASSGDAIGTQPDARRRPGRHDAPTATPSRSTRHARGRALHPPRPRLPRRGRPRPVRRARRRAARARPTWTSTTGAAAGVGLGGDRSSPAAARRPSARRPCSTTRSATRTTASRRKNGGKLPLRRPAHDVLPAGRVRDQLPLRAVPQPARPQRRQESHGLQLLHLRRPGDADDARLPGRPDEDPPHARRRREVPRLPPARRRRPVALQPASPTPTFNYADTGAATRTRRRSRRRRSGSTPSRSARASPTTSRSRAAPAACSSRAGDFLFHCHIAKHYVSGMWGFWRVYDTAPARPRAAAATATPPPAAGRLAAA